MPALRRLLLVCLLGFAALAVPALSAAAPDTVLTFEDRPVSATENIDMFSTIIALGIIKPSKIWLRFCGRARRW